VQELRRQGISFENRNVVEHSFAEASRVAMSQQKLLRVLVRSAQVLNGALLGAIFGVVILMMFPGAIPFPIVLSTVAGLLLAAVFGRRAPWWQFEAINSS
jgi:zinc transporter ZupT